LSGARALLEAEDFPLPRTPAPATCGPGEPLIPLPDGGLDFDETLAWIERSILEQALRKTGGNKQAAADMLRLKRTTLAAKVRSLEERSSPPSIFSDQLFAMPMRAPSRCNVS
jgi:DNA-binding NtrC family response regulator